MDSIKEMVQGEIIVKNSRFIGFIIPVESESFAMGILSKLKLDYPGASHYCYAYIIGDSGNFQKASDDGEPQKTAGIPILEVLKKNNLTNVIAVSIRYFGGTLLGAPGLVRAYSKSISSLLESVIRTRKRNYQRYSIEMDYKEHNHLENYLRSKVIIEETSFTEKVSVLFSVLEEESMSVMNHLRETIFHHEIKYLGDYSIYSEF